MSTSNNDLNKPQEPITKRIARAVVSALIGNGNGTPTRAPANEASKEEPQPVKAEEPKAPEAPVTEKKPDDQPIYGRRSTRPFIPNPLGG